MMNSKIEQLLTRLDDLSGEILRQLRVKKVITQVEMNEYYSVLDQLTNLLYKEHVISKKITNEVYYLLSMILVESNYAERDQMSLLNEFLKLGSKLSDLFSLEEPIVDEKINNLTMEVMNLSNVIKISLDQGIIPRKPMDDLNYLFQQSVKFYENENFVPKSLASALLNVCLLIITYSNYLNNPIPGNLIRSSQDDIKEPIVTEYWKNEELLGKFMGLSY
ncbi:hypothetical protein [uncultured Brevibacillus sp.]|uniref:hypothetical protein n=1 Tax=uncultured Brevibacillus sp. TaxID=169970 RepID=UPI0025975922|nr:hypothetical protein [uncultured Brevibacillus sp.]